MHWGLAQDYILEVEDPLEHYLGSLVLGLLDEDCFHQVHLEYFRRVHFPDNWEQEEVELVGFLATMDNRRCYDQEHRVVLVDVAHLELRTYSLGVSFPFYCC